MNAHTQSAYLHEGFTSKHLITLVTVDDWSPSVFGSDTHLNCQHVVHQLYCPWVKYSKVSRCFFPHDSERYCLKLLTAAQKAEGDSCVLLVLSSGSPPKLTHPYSSSLTSVMRRNLYKAQSPANEVTDAACPSSNLRNRPPLSDLAWWSLFGLCAWERFSILLSVIAYFFCC